MATRSTPAFEIIRTTTGVGDNEASTLPATTACAAAAPDSKGRSATSRPCFLKKPSSLATYATTVPNTGGTPGSANVIGSAAGGAPEALHARVPNKPIANLRHGFLDVVMSALRHGACPALRFELELRPARLIHQGRPDVLAQLGEPGRGQGLASPRMGQGHFHDLGDGARPALQDDHAVAHQHRLVDRGGDEDHRGGAHP